MLPPASGQRPGRADGVERRGIKFRKKIPVTLVGGFLGAGKTTLLNRRVSSGELRYGVVVNEFGDVGVDSGLMERLDSEGVAELDSGCLCCVGRDDLAVVLYSLVNREEPPEYVLIELSGLADPVPVAQMLLTTEFRGLLELDGIVAVADARNLEETLRENPEGEAQLKYANVVLLNKTDQVESDTVRQAEETVAEMNPLARVIPTRHAEVEAADVTGLHGFDAGWKAPGHETRHSNGVITFTLRSERPLQLGRWILFHQNMMINRPGSVYRAKGIMQFEELDYPMVLQAVRDLYSFDAYDGDHDGGAEVVVIGKDLDEAEYRQAFERVISEEELETQHPPDQLF